MTYIPDVPLWCWVLQGEDALFFPNRRAPCSVSPTPGRGGALPGRQCLRTRWLEAQGCCGGALSAYDAVFYG